MNTRLKSELLLGFATAIWGGTYAIIKTGLNDISPVLFVAIRFFLAFLFFLPALLRSGRELSTATLQAGFVLGVTMFGGYALLTAGLVLTSSGRSGLITYSFALFVPFLQVLLLRKKVRTVNLLGLFMVIFGMYVFTSAPSSPGTGWNRGDILTFLAAISYAFNIVYLDRYSRRHSPSVLTGLQFAVMTVLAVLYVLFFEAPFINFTFSFFLSLFYLSVLGSVIAISLMNRYQKDTTPVRAVIIYALEPVLAVVSGWLFLGEKIGIYGMIGGAVIIGGVLLSEVLGIYLDKRNTGNSEEKKVHL